MATAAETLFTRVRDAVEAKLGSASGCHDFDHTLRVYANAKMLAAELPEADGEIVARDMRGDEIEKALAEAVGK